MWNVDCAFFVFGLNPKTCPLWRLVSVKPCKHKPEQVTMLKKSASCVPSTAMSRSVTSRMFPDRPHTHAQTAHHVEEECIMRTLHSSVQVSVRADDTGGLAPQLQSDGLDPLSRLLHDDLAHLCASSEGNLVNPCMHQQPKSRFFMKMLLLSMLAMNAAFSVLLMHRQQNHRQQKSNRSK